MCWCFPFGALGPKKRKPPPQEERKRRRERHASPLLHGDGVAVAEEVQEKVYEKRRSSGSRSSGSQRGEKRKSPKSKSSPNASRREREERRPQQDSRYHYDTYRNRDYYERPALNVEVPEMWHREAEIDGVNDSTEMLLNPRPHRSPHERQRHPKRTSQSTLRGRGAKRDPPRKSKSKGTLRQPPRQSGWSLFLSPPPQPKTPRRSHRSQQTYDSSPRSHRSQRHHDYQQIPETSYSSQSQSHRHRSSRQHSSQPHSSHHHGSRSRTPNTAARREPDRRFAVLAATNQALEEVRREAFAHPSPPPRRQRVRRYQGVTVPTSTIPFDWDCVSSSQSAATPRGEDVESGYVI